ncbi:MAG: YceH family protein [Patulibacter sp.]
MKPDAAQIRVLGALLEKQRTTPDAYPLTLNGLRSACNQSTNRDPVVDYDEATIKHALEELSRRRWTRNVGGSRAAKYRHMLVDTLQIAPDEQAVLSVLMLRGPQTPGELRQRTPRLHAFADADELEATVDRLVERRLVVRLERQPGQKEGRVQQVMGGDEPAGEISTSGGQLAVAEAVRSAPSAAPSPAPSAALVARIERLEATVRGGASTAPHDRLSPEGVAGLDERVSRVELDVADLRSELAALREELGA